MTDDFIAFPKVPRLSREVIVTEKIDGTNSQVFITEDGEIRAGSRNRWLTKDADNFGFAAWVEAHRSDLLRLGPGRHYGEWWGSGIQRRYGLDHKRFSLFNVSRWLDAADLPSCCHVVPMLYRGVFSTEAIEDALDRLRQNGSVAAPGFMKPEGIIAYHVAGGFGFKKTLEKDEEPKGKQLAA